MKPFKLILAFTLFIMVSNCISAQSIDVTALDNDIKIQQLLDKYKVPAVGIGLIRNYELRQVIVTGNLKKGAPAPYNTIFNVASLTKPIVGMLTLKLVSSGDWDLDEPLAHYWTDPDLSTDPRSKKITTRHVLRHQTGFKNWRYLHPSGKLTIEFEPGTKFGYSGEGLEYLRKSLEKKFGKSLSQLADSLIFNPIGMPDSRLVWDNKVDESRFALWHDKEGNNIYPTAKRTEPNAADDLLTTVTDFGRFCSWVMKGNGLSKKIQQEMITPQVNIAANDHFGLVWEIITIPNSKEFALVHSGGDKGVQTLAILCPISGEGLIIFTNGDNGDQLYPELVSQLLSIGKDLVKHL